MVLRNFLDCRLYNLSIFFYINLYSFFFERYINLYSKTQQLKLLGGLQKLSKRALVLSFLFSAIFQLKEFSKLNLNLQIPSFVIHFFVYKIVPFICFFPLCFGCLSQKEKVVTFGSESFGHFVDKKWVCFDLQLNQIWRKKN